MVVSRIDRLFDVVEKESKPILLEKDEILVSEILAKLPKFCNPRRMRLWSFKINQRPYLALAKL